MQHHKDNRLPTVGLDLSLNASAQRVIVQSAAETLPVFDKLEAWMRVCGYRRKDLFAVKLALGEAALNAAQHGNQGDWSKGVGINYLVTADEVVIEVEDNGEGFDPSQVPHPLTPGLKGRMTRRGLFLMRSYMNGVSFNPQGNRVTMYRLRSIK